MSGRGRNGRQILDSKVRIPKTAHSLVERKALLEELEADGARVIVLHAGAGFGKTVLMAELARRQGNPCVWYQSDRTDNDAVSFLRGLLYALSEVSEEYESACRELELQGLSGEQFDKAVITLVEMLSKQQEKVLYFMMDDFQEIQEGRIFTLMKHLIDYTPSTVRFCFTVKGEFPYFLAAYIMRGEVRLLESDRLRFTREETEELLRFQNAGKADPEMVDGIQSYTEGWPAGVRFACLAMRTDNGTRDIVTALSHTKVFDYIYYEIFRKLPYDLQCFLLDTSALHYLSPMLCNVVTGRDDSAGLLQYLVGEEMFLYKFDGPKKWYRYHSIFRDFLKSRQDAQRKKEVLVKAAQYSMRSGETEQAVAYAMECEAYSVVEVAVERQSLEMMRQGRQATLDQWIRYLEDSQRPLSSACAHSIGQYFREEDRIQEAEKYLKLAVEEAYVSEDYDNYCQYGMEFVQFLEELYGIRKAVSVIEKMEGPYDERKMPGIFRLHKKHLEYRLQMEDRKWLEDFADRTAGRTRKLQMAMERNAVIWAMGLDGKTDGWGNTLEEARMYRRVSLVFAEYGFYRYGWFLYRKKDPEYRQVVQEGLSMEGRSIFSQWMKLLWALDAYKTGQEDIQVLREELLQIEDKAEQQGAEYPELLKEDEKLLTDILLGREQKVEVPVTGKKPEQAVPLLKVYCLGSFLVQAGEEMVAWRTKKVKELFASLFTQNGKGMEKSSLVYRLWPEATEKNGSTLFNTTVSYLRKALAQVGAADLLLVRDKMYSLDMNRIWSDYGRLEEIAEMVRKKKFDRIESWKELGLLYRGEYLGSEDYRWTLGMKEYVEQLYIRTVEQAAIYEEQCGNDATTVMLLQKLLEMNAVSSEMLRLLLKCRIRQGDRNGAKKQYEKIRKFWEEEWDQELPEDMTDFLNDDKGEKDD